ncbi:MAG: hypothetical protein VX845_05215, partial [Candidatus Thermoplasmatota archaeon]|nr:hypothetical protein [Candidatus Thermoplasmatota archaeon]
MRRIALLMITLVVLLPLNVQAGAPVAVDDGAVFGSHGGAVSSANSSAVALEDLDPILEDYTATWCTNCVDVEHALEDLVAERGGHIFAFHRSIGETEDPFGSDALDERWEQRYDRRAPPTVVFNGTTYVIGSVPEGDSLLDDYRALANQSLDLPTGGTSVFSWTTAQSGSTTVTWDVNLPPSSAWNGHLVRLEVWVVEATANFPEGTNGQEDYPHIVRSISTVDELVWNEAVSLQGSSALALPPAFDGDDLEVYLVHNLVPPTIPEVLE